MSDGLTHEQAMQQLNLQAAADFHVDKRLDVAVDRTFRAADQTLNGTMRSFLREVSLLQRLPFPQSEPQSNG